MSSDTFGFTPETIESVRFILHSPAWTDFFAPVLLGVREAGIQELLNPSEERRKRASDDYLRGRVNTVDALLSIGETLVSQADPTQSSPGSENQEFADRASSGLYGPLPPVSDDH